MVIGPLVWHGAPVGSGTAHNVHGSNSKHKQGHYSLKDNIKQQHGIKDLKKKKTQIFEGTVLLWTTLIFITVQECQTNVSGLVVKFGFVGSYAMFR